MVIFGGKGGVGKTTSAAATAMYLSHRHPKKRIAVASSDPAHSLADSFDCPVNGSVTAVKGVHNLWAVELDSAALLKKFRKKHKSALERLQIMSYSSDQADLREFLSFRLPGMEDMALLLEIGRLLRGGYGFDLVILDTAPTGHTLRLLALPKQVLKWIELFRTSVAGYRWFAGALASQGLFTIPGITTRSAGNVPEFLETLSKDLGKIDAVLKNPDACDFVVVTIAEDMGIAESERLLGTLKQEGIGTRNLVVNRVQEEGQCPFCSSRRRGQEGALHELDEKFAGYNLIRVPTFPHEVRGAAALLTYAEHLAGHHRPTSPPRPARRLGETASLPVGTTPVGPISDIVDGSLDIIVFSGKGGVGKTTVSAATALALAERNPEKKVLVVSLDPAHSLSDSFACPIGESITRMHASGQLSALEADGKRLYEEFKRDYKETMEKAFRKLKDSGKYAWGREAKLKMDENLLSRLVGMYPPGVEDALALERIGRFVENKDCDVCIIDTAPTGHIMKLLKKPGLVIDWLNVASRAIVKYHRDVFLDSFERLNEQLLGAHRAVRKMQTLLTDPEASAFVAVTIPEAMGVLETEDLLADIHGLGIQSKHVVVNMIVPPTNCDFCLPKREEHLSYTEIIKNAGERFGYGLCTVPLFPHEIRGIDQLRELSKLLFGDRSAVRQPPEPKRADASRGQRQGSRAGADVSPQRP
ncbi:MAG: ArsA family ATPase [Anaerolineae bacterium]